MTRLTKDIRANLADRLFGVAMQKEYDEIAAQAKALAYDVRALARGRLLKQMDELPDGWLATTAYTKAELGGYNITTQLYYSGQWTSVMTGHHDVRMVGIVQPPHVYERATYREGHLNATMFTTRGLTHHPLNDAFDELRASQYSFIQRAQQLRAQLNAAVAGGVHRREAGCRVARGGAVREALPHQAGRQTSAPRDPRRAPERDDRLADGRERRCEMNRRALLKLLGGAVALPSVGVKTAASALGIPAAMAATPETYDAISSGACAPVFNSHGWWGSAAETSLHARRAGRERVASGDAYPHMKSWGRGFRTIITEQDERIHALFIRRMERDSDFASKMLERLLGDD